MELLLAAKKVGRGRAPQAHRGLRSPGVAVPTGAVRSASLSRVYSFLREAGAAASPGQRAENEPTSIAGPSEGSPPFHLCLHIVTREFHSSCLCG